MKTARIEIATQFRGYQIDEIIKAVRKVDKSAYLETKYTIVTRKRDKAMKEILEIESNRP